MIKLDHKINNSETEQIQKCRRVIILVKQLMSSSGHWKKLKFRESTKNFLLEGFMEEIANGTLHVAWIF